MKKEQGRGVVIFGLFKKKKPPIIKPDMIEPADYDISLADAKKLYKQFIGEYTDLDNQDISQGVKYFAQEVKDHQEYLKDLVAEKQDEIIFEQDRIKEYKNDIKACEDEDEIADINEDIKNTESDIQLIKKELQELKENKQRFSKNKRDFLVDYVNSELHDDYQRQY